MAQCCIPDCTFIAVPESTHPLCQMHRHEVAAELGRQRYEAARLTRETVKAKRDEGAVVYYVDFGDRIKIGYTSNLPVRLTQLRVNPDAVLAIEPGARDVEQQRHHEFRSIRVSSKREDFWKREPLLTHIRYVQATHPQPHDACPTRAP